MNDSVDQTTENASAITPQLVEIRIDQIIQNEYQPRKRFAEAELVDLSESIREVGVLQPILVRPYEDGLFELIAGERRWRAARRADLETIPAVIREIDDQTSLEHAIVENLHREDLNCLEEATAYQQLIDEFELTQADVATRVGKSRSAVTNTIRLLQLPLKVQKMVLNNELTAGHAKAILMLDSPLEQEALAMKVRAEGLRVRETEKLATTFSTTPKVSKETQSNAYKSTGYLEVERLLADYLSTKVEVVNAQKRGKLIIDFADSQDLTRIFELLYTYR